MIANGAAERSHGTSNCVIMLGQICHRGPLMPVLISVAQLKHALHQPGEIALIDVREAGESGEGRPLLAVNIPYSLLELRAPKLAPCPRARLVVMDNGSEDVRAARAYSRLVDMGYVDVHVLDGGLQAWESAGHGVFKGVNVPSKTFGELLEHACDTPSIGADELAELCASKTPPVILDGRTPAEHDRMSIPGGVSCPNGELGLRVSQLCEPDDLVVVNCAGRTRSIVGAQTLIDMGVPNRVVALRNGTMGWRLAGFELDQSSGLTHPLETPPKVLEAAQSSAKALAKADGIETVTGAQVDSWIDSGLRSVFLLDVRTAAEFAAGHQSGAVHAPGGQLVQATDQWVGVRGAVLVLIDDEQVRAPLVARWLQRMGHYAVVLAPGDSVCARDAGVSAPQWSELEKLSATAMPADATVIDVRSSAAYDACHINGSIWSIRPRLAELKLSGVVVLIADSEQIAALAAGELTDSGAHVKGWLSGEPDAWQDAGLELVSEPKLADSERIDYLFFVHDRHDGNMAAARAYLEWETGLLAQLDRDERSLFTL